MVNHFRPTSSHMACTALADDLLFHLASGPQGLSAEAAASRLGTYGPNELPAEEEEPLWKKFLEKLREPMIALLMASAGISLLTGQYNDAISIFIAVLIVVTVAFVQEFKSDESLAALSKLAPHRCAAPWRALGPVPPAPPPPLTLPRPRPPPPPPSSQVQGDARRAPPGH